MKKMKLTALALALCVLLSACTGGRVEETAAPSPTPVPTAPATPTPKPEPVRFALPCFPEQSFHPITGGSKTNLMIAPLMYEGLYALDGAFEPHGVLCESAAVSEDALSWTFTLHAGITFSDGSALTAGDVVSALREAMAAGSPYASRLAGITAVRAEDDLRLTLSLSAPNANLPALLDVPVVKGGGDRPAGTGPYALTGEGDALVLSLRADWWRDEPMPMSSIPLNTIQGNDGLVRAFDTRAVSLVTADLTGASALGYSGSYETWEYPTSSLLYLGYHADQKSLCADPALRKALSYAVEREETTKSLLAGHAVAAELPLPPASSLYDESLAKQYATDGTKAAALLDEAGWTLGEDGVRYRGSATLSLVLLTSAENTYKVAVARHLADVLSAAGVAVTLRSVPWSDYLAALEAGNFDLYLGETKLTADFDLTALIAPGGALNYGKYADAEATALLAAYRAAGGADRKTAAAALYTRLGETAPFTPVCFKTWSALTHWGRLTGLNPTQQNLFYGFENWKWSG